jgi:hypothetical protein
MRNFIAYYERTWIGAPTNKTHGDKAGQKRKAPRVSCDIWNHRADILLGNEITSNYLGSYNSSSKVSSSNFICSLVTSLFLGQSPLEAFLLVHDGFPQD